MALALAVSLVGCDKAQPAKSKPPAPLPTSRKLHIVSCDQVPCTGVIGGARYEFKLPAQWNGTLLLWSHGYRQTKPKPPSRTPQSNPESAPSPESANALLAQGFALAGSAYARNGWAVTDGVTAGEQLYAKFVALVGKPQRTYVWGASLGGLITATLAEKHPDWVSGAAPLCGVLAGANLTSDLALDVTYAVKTLLYPRMKLAHFTNGEDATANFNGAFKALSAARNDSRSGVPKLLLIAALIDAPTRSGSDDGSSAASRLNAVFLSVVTMVLYGTVVKFDLEQRSGGNPSTNIATDYRARITVAEAADAEALSPGSVNRNLTLLAGGERVSADTSARETARGLGQPSGVLRDPTVTLHTVIDPLVLVQNESVFRSRVAAASGEGSAKLLQLYTKPPDRYTNAKYAAGHCSFSTEEWTGVVGVLDMMVRTGKRPSEADIKKAFAGDSRLALDYVAPSWPAPSD